MQHPKTKSDLFRQMYDQGYTIAQIARTTNNYYSFVHRVIRRYEREQTTDTQTTDTQNTNTQTTDKPNKEEIIELHQQNYTVDDILEHFKLQEDDRSYVYSVIKKAKQNQNQNQNQKEAKV